jgi:hypothetical protein
VTRKEMRRTCLIGFMSDMRPNLRTPIGEVNNAKPKK